MVVEIDAYRRNVQRTYLDLIDDRLNGRSPAEDDARPFLRGELRALDRSIASALAQVSDRPTRLHLEDVQDQIDRILNPLAGAPAPSRGGSSRAFDDVTLAGALVDPWSAQAQDGESCWPDYAIRIDRP